MTDALRKAAQDVVDCEQYQGSFYVTYRIEKLNALREALAAPAPDAGEDVARTDYKALYSACADELDALRTKLDAYEREHLMDHQPERKP